MRYGLDKLAAIGSQTEVDASGAETENNKETTITCISDCMYAQNPEKTCMLKNVTLSMTKPGSFDCGQYSPLNSQNPAAQGVSTERPTQDQTQEEKAQGLDKVKQ